MRYLADVSRKCSIGIIATVRYSARFTMFVLIAALTFSCAVKTIKVRETKLADVQKREYDNALVNNDPSAATMQTLRLLSVDKVWRKEPLAVLESLDKSREGMNGRILAAVAELAMLEGLLEEEDNPSMAASWFLMAAARSYEYLFEDESRALVGAFDSHYQRMRDTYNVAVGKYVALLQELQQGPPLDHMGIFLNQKLQMKIECGPGVWTVDFFDKYVPTFRSEVKGLRNHYVEPGVGAAFTAIHERRGEGYCEQFFPPSGIVYAVSAVLTFHRKEENVGGEYDRAVLCFYDPRHVERVPIDDLMVPLAADFTTPFAYQMARSRLKQRNVRGLMQRDDTLKEEDTYFGIYLNEPYDPQKIPVLLVHGLMSSPLAWMEITNDITGDPELRANFQLWHFRYPTGQPYLYSAMLLRRALDNLRSHLDPDQDDPAMQSMVLLAHSMGGLLSKTLVSDSGENIWHSLIKAPPEAIVAAREDMESIRSILHFKPAPYVGRVIFIATPHRGSEAAHGFLGRLGAQLVRLPQEFIGLMERLVKGNQAYVAEELLEQMDKGGPVSIRALHPSYPVMIALSKLPIDENVPYHSIIGDRGRGDGPNGSDGFVTYASSHLEGAESEVIVPTDHGAYTHPLTIAEVKRILRQHLTEKRNRKRGAFAEAGPL